MFKRLWMPVFFGLGLVGCGQSDSSARSTPAVSSSSQDPEQVPEAPFVPPEDGDEGEIVDHMELLSAEQRTAVESFCEALSRLSGDPEPYDTKVCESGDAQVILKLEAEQAGSSQPLVERLAQCARDAQTPEELGSCRSR